MTAGLLIAAAVAAGGMAHVAEAAGEYARWRTYTTGDGLPHNRIRALHATGGQLWVATDRGLAVHDEDGWRIWTDRDGLPSSIVTAIDVDPRTDDVWLGTWGGGIVRLSGGRFDRFDQLNSPLAGNLVFDLVVAGDRVWAATNGGLTGLDPRQEAWELHFPRRARAPEMAVMGLAADDRHLYAAAWCRGLRRLDLADGTWTTLAADEIVNDAFPAVRDTTVDVALAGGSLWWAMRDGMLLRRADAGPWAAGRPPRTGSIHCVAVGGDGVVAVGTDRGLKIVPGDFPGPWGGLRPGDDRSRPGGAAIEIRAPVLPDDDVRCLAFAGDAIWVGTVNGLARGTPTNAGPRSDVAQDSASEREVVDGGQADGGPGRPWSTVEAGEDPAVRIGILRPGNRTVTVPGTDAPGVPRLGRLDLMAVNLALERANAAGGFRGRLPFAFATGPRGSFDGWGWTTPEDDFPALARQPEVVGIVGYLGSGSCLTTAVTLRTEVPLVNAAPTPPSTDEDANPWIFRCRGDGERRHRRVLEDVLDRLECRRAAVIRTPGQTAHTRLESWIDQLRARGGDVVIDLSFDPVVDDPGAGVEDIERSGADVVLTWTDASSSAAILGAIRDAGMDQVFVGSGEIISDAFATLAGPDAGHVFAGDLAAAEDRAFDRFAEAYRKRFKRPPDRDAFLLFQAVDHLLEAINAAGPDRVAVRNELARMSRDPSSEGHAEGTDEVVVGRLRDCAWEFHRVEDHDPEQP